ncbi:MAG TPA: tetratricopeptide repeat protein, partial [Gemmatimonadetes bacterium]|nr:tetratricopeptide repeat protein [Gemmatimonadota bacterium]
LLRLAIESAQDDDAVRHSLGLLLVRQNRLEEAIAELRAAAEARPDDARYVYVYGVALHSAGEVEVAIRVLVEAYTRHPADIDIFMALLTYHRDSGALDEAIALAQQWLELRPDDGAVRQELANLERLRDAPGPT